MDYTCVPYLGVCKGSYDCMSHTYMYLCSVVRVSIMAAIRQRHAEERAILGNNRTRDRVNRKLDQYGFSHVIHTPVAQLCL